MPSLSLMRSKVTPEKAYAPSSMVPSAAADDALDTPPEPLLEPAASGSKAPAPPSQKRPAREAPTFVEDEAGGDLECDIAIIGGGPTLFAAVNAAASGGKYRVAAVLGNAFFEYSHGAALFLTTPKKHKQFLCAAPEGFMRPGVTYLHGEVDVVDAEDRILRFRDRKSTLRFKAVIVASGRRLPLLRPRPGDSLLERMREVRAVGKALASAHTVLLCGAGAIGVELAAEIRLRHPQIKRVVLLAPSGRALATTHPEEVQVQVTERLRAIGVEIVAARLPEDFDASTPRLEPGTVALVPQGGDDDGAAAAGLQLSFDVYLPSFAQGANTEFLSNRFGVQLDGSGFIVATSCLQAVGRPEVFGAGTTAIPLAGHPVETRLAAQAITCARNAKRFLEGALPLELEPYDDRALIPRSHPRPYALRVGYGRGGFALWDGEAAAVTLDPVNLLMCGAWGGGFPFCPPPCCWCAPGCASCCGKCRGPPEGEGLARFFESTLLPFAMQRHLRRPTTSMTSVGVMIPPEALEMSRLPL